MTERKMTLKNTSLFPWFKSLYVQSNASANHLELVKLDFASFVAMFCLKFVTKYLRKQQLLLKREWMEFDLVQSGQEL